MIRSDQFIHFRSRVQSYIIQSACLLFAAPLAFATPIQMASAPESTLSLTLSAINSAQKSILVNIYDLSSPEIVNAIVNQISRGVHVEVLEEGQPVGGISAAARGMQASIAQAMSQAGNGDRLVEMTSKGAQGKVKRRFRYDHAKYIVVDESSIVVGSENYSPTGQPEPGTAGNRGWEVWVQDGTLAQQFEQMFESDSSTQNPDIEDLLTSSSTMALDLPLLSSRKPKPKPVDPSAGTGTGATEAGRADASQIQAIASPNSSESGILNLINSAHSTLMIEQMELAPSWKQGKSAVTSPLMDAIVAAARRGVKVWVLLNDERVFAHGGKVDSKNTTAVASLNQTASSESLQLQARIANLKAMGVTYIHNKGVLVDGQTTLISSINWDQNSIEKNRETALIVTSPDVYHFYEQTFESDWNHSATAGDGTFDPGSSSDEPTDGVDDTNVELQTLSVVTERSAPSAASEACPSSVSATINIGDVSLEHPVDASFRALQGAEIHASFKPMGRGCAFRSQSNVGPLFMELRDHAGGKWLAMIEGYTPEGKLFSIRGQVSESTAQRGEADVKGTVYDASAGGRPVRIAGAKIDLSFKFAQ